MKCAISHTGTAHGLNYRSVDMIYSYKEHTRELKAIEEELNDLKKTTQKLKSDKRNLEVEVENLNEVSISKPKKRRLETLRVLNSTNKESSTGGLEIFGQRFVSENFA